MKKLIVTAMAALVVSGCKQEDPGTSSPDGKTEVILRGATGSSVDTRTFLDDTEGAKVPVLWSTGDAIGIFTYTSGASAANAKGSLMEGAGARDGKFVSLGIEMAPTGNMFYMYYPYDANATNISTPSDNDTPVKYNGTDTDNPFITGFLPATQDQLKPDDLGHFAKYGYSVAVSEPADAGQEIDFTMEHLLSYVQLSLYGSGDLAGYSVSQITFETPVNTQLTGYFNGYFKPQSNGKRFSSFSSSDPTLFSNAITLDITEPEALTDDAGNPQRFILSMLPVDLSNQNIKVVVTLSKTEGTDTHIRFYATNIDGKNFKEDCLTRIKCNVNSWTRIYPMRVGIVWQEGVTIDPSSIELISAAEGTDLSAKHANSYIVPTTGGTFTIPAKKGDGSWVEGIDSDKLNYLKFTVPACPAGANAVIGVYRWNPDDPTNQSNTILYSWHLWITDPAEVLVDGTTTFLDRDLGATSADRTSLDALSYYYQWGRKDLFPRASQRGPFTGPEDETAFNETGTYGYTRPVVFNTSIFANLKWTLVRSKQDYNDTYQKPTTFIDGTVLGTNQFNMAMTEGHRNMPSYNNKAISTWADHADPCPFGYHVPTVDELSLLIGVPKGDATDLANRGITVKGLWFPHAGYRNNEYANFRALGSQGLLWANITNQGSEIGRYARSWHCDYNGNPYFAQGRISGGRTVRCVKN